MAKKIRPPKISSKIRTKVKDRGYSAILKEMEKIEKEPCVKVGLPVESEKTNSKYDSEGKEKTTTLMVGVAHEFGTTKLPERSWLRASHDAMTPKMNALIKKLYKAILEGKITVSRALTIMGIFAESETKKYIYDNKVTPPSKKSDFSSMKFRPAKNSPVKAPMANKTISLKTLIDTSQLVNSITFVKKMNGVKGK